MTLSEREVQRIAMIGFYADPPQLWQLRRSVVGQAGGVSVDRDGGRPPRRARSSSLPCRQALFANSCGFATSGQGKGAQTLHRRHWGRGKVVAVHVVQSTNTRTGFGK